MAAKNLTISKNLILAKFATKLFKNDKMFVAIIFMAVQLNTILKSVIFWKGQESIMFYIVKFFTKSPQPNLLL